ncbi:MAG: hypothetical protein ACP5HK_04565 [Acidilobus sp.]
MESAVPLFTPPPWATALFYAVLGLLFGVLAERTNYCIIVATHQVMGVKYSKTYEMMLTGIAVSSLLAGILVAAGLVPAVDAYKFAQEQAGTPPWGPSYSGSCSVRAAWSECSGRQARATWLTGSR